MNAPLRHPVSTKPDTGIAIIGAGFSGMCMAIKLKEAGRTDFVIFEKGADIGGTWRDNHYPGCACDVPSHLYSYSFEPNPDWSRMYGSQKEIRDYQHHCAEKYGLRPFCRFNEGIEKAEFDEVTALWRITTTKGAHLTARVIVSGVGALCLPAYPRIKGLDSFEGKAFHSAEWDHGYDLRGKTVAVIGTGASAIQFVPELQKQVRKLHLFQRTAPWILPKKDRPIREWEKALFRAVPFLHWLFRQKIYWQMEMRALGFTVNPKIMKRVEKLALEYLDTVIPDPALRRKLTPDYLIGCKRILISNEYYPALTQANVEVVTDGIAEVRPHSIVTADGTERPVDALIYGTGFKATDPLAEMKIFGRGGIEINEVWSKAGGAEAYYGIAAAGFPNFFMLLGPNTGLGHNTIIFMIEAQANYVMQCLKLMDERQLATFEVRADVHRNFNAAIQQDVQKTVWNSGCKSWYLTENGKNTTIWPGFTFTYWARTRRMRPRDFEFTAAQARAAAE